VLKQREFARFAVLAEHEVIGVIALKKLLAVAEQLVLVDGDGVLNNINMMPVGGTAEVAADGAALRVSTIITRRCETQQTTTAIALQVDGMHDAAGRQKLSLLLSSLVWTSRFRTDDDDEEDGDEKAKNARICHCAAKQLHAGSTVANKSNAQRLLCVISSRLHAERQSASGHAAATSPLRRDRRGAFALRNGQQTAIDRHHHRRRLARCRRGSLLLLLLLLLVDGDGDCGGWGRCTRASRR